MYAAWTFAGSCRENTVSGVLLVAGGILVVVNGRADVRREPRGRMNSLWKKRGCCTGDTDLRACASALQRALLRLTGVRAGFSFRRNAFSIAEEGNRAEKELPVRVKLHKCIAVGSKNQNFSY